ncbi:MAG TPA: hypothetical protein PLJ32_00110 [Kiritimatiellia bacterium]|jgi:hypothetical protein|nr:hypothetical protein [Kiritimatiellia bacterium]
MRKRGIFVCACLISMVAGAVTNVFEMPLLYPKHLALQQQLMRVVRTGETEEMERICREGVALLPRDPTWQYNLACALAYRADKGEALAALDRAIDLGFRDAAAIEADRDLKSLGPIKAFRELLDKARRLQGKPVEGMPTVRPVSVVMGRPAEVNAENTIWDFEFGCFRTRFNLLVPDLRPVSDYAEAYRGAAAETVRAGFKAGTASGNFGDLYVNRDGNHSLLVVSNYPGLTPVVYGEQAKQAQVHLSLPNGLFDAPVLGNASLSMVSGPYWRSLPRAAVTDPLRAIISLRFYLGNQIWVFPEHRDHDPETGDLYPVNAPFFVISQGSSGSDQPFVNAFAATLAAFTPATKRALTQRNRIGPTLQRILRITQKAVAKDEERYLTGAAHPVVFDAAQLDVEAMVRMAQAMTPEAIPPLVALRTVEDAKVQAGLDFFDLRSEGLFDTPCCIARVVRGVSRERVMTVEAAVPGQQQEGAFRWTVLQGDTRKIVITPLNANASRVKLTVSYHGAFRPVDDQGMPSALLRHRVDIGCFARHGKGYTAPSIISFYYLPNEVRAYRDDGQVLSVDYTNAEHRYADPMLTFEKGWKDLYAYDDQGRLTGWYRTRPGRTPERFTYLGHKVLQADSRDRPVQACAVEYLPRQTGGQQTPPTLTCVETRQRFAYSYADDADRIGRATAEP